jgi:NitT/TauT family transport system substrate-binding protein
MEDSVEKRRIPRAMGSTTERVNRRVFLRRAAVAGSVLAAAPQIVSRRALGAGPMRTIRFSEAVHNLGYIDLYVARDKGFFQDQGIELQLSAAGGDTQAFASVLGKSAEFGCGDSTLAEISLEKGGPGVTSLTGSAERLYEIDYCARGQAENFIKLHKTQLASDRTSCQ